MRGVSTVQGSQVSVACRVGWGVPLNTEVHPNHNPESHAPVTMAHSPWSGLCPPCRQTLPSLPSCADPHQQLPRPAILLCGNPIFRAKPHPQQRSRVGACPPRCPPPQTCPPCHHRHRHRTCRHSRRLAVSKSVTCHRPKQLACLHANPKCMRTPCSWLAVVDGAIQRDVPLSDGEYGEVSRYVQWIAVHPRRGMCGHPPFRAALATSAAFGSLVTLCLVCTLLHACNLSTIRHTEAAVLWINITRVGAELETAC